jgi:hypothetical protein
MPALLRVVARHPVLAFMVIGIGAGFLTAAIRPIAEAEVLPFGLPLHGVLGGAFGVGLGAFVVTGALSGRDGIVDLARRGVRWRVPVRWYLVQRCHHPDGHHRDCRHQRPTRTSQSSNCYRTWTPRSTEPRTALRIGGHRVDRLLVG